MIQVANWEKFQHYKGRRPLWIKVYRDLLERQEWHALSGDASKLLVECWLIASEFDGGAIPLDIPALTWRLRRADPVRVLALLQEIALQGFITMSEDIASGLLASRKQDACLEERRGELERETEKTTTQRVAFVENSGTDSPAYSRFDLLEHAKRECGLGKWNPQEIRTASSVIVSWTREHKTASAIFEAIHGARMLVDAGKVRWERDGQLSIRPRQSFGLQALRNTFVLASQGDGEAPRPFFDVAREEYIRQCTGPPTRTASSGLANVGSILQNLVPEQPKASA